MNVLFILVDDLCPVLGCYGHPIVQTPHMDALAKEGVVFTRNYCQVALCSPSRTALLSGLRPDTSRVWWIGPHFREHVPDALALPQHFKNHGYHTQAFGKVYHDAKLDDPLSWSEPLYVPKTPPYGPEEMPKFFQEQQRLAEMEKTGITTDPQTGLPLFLIMPGPSWEAPDVPDEYFWDGIVAREALSAIERHKDGPFFITAGFVKPHLPYVAPRRYFDLYAPESIVLPEYCDVPVGAPEVAINPQALNEWARYRDFRRLGPVHGELARELIRAYYAATSYVDAQTGRLLRGLDALGLSENTVIVLWGDNGYKLGEYGYFGKETNFELDTHVPLIIRAPHAPAAGQACHALTESMDVYPTLCELCGLDIPGAVEASSLAPMLRDVDVRGKDAAFSQYFRDGLMGYSIRTEQYRYTEWVPFEPSASAPAPDWEHPKARELYDHTVDPHETRNRAGEAQYVDTIIPLHKRLKQGWRAVGA